MRVAIYIRVSALDQAREGYSLAAQRAALERWAAERGHEAASLLANNSITFRDNSQEKMSRYVLTNADEGGIISMVTKRDTKGGRIA